MKTLELPDRHHAFAAQGWLELGNYEEAAKELDKVSLQSQSHPEVLKLRCRVYARSKNWSAAADMAKTVWDLGPSHLINRFSQELPAGDETAHADERAPVNPLVTRFPLFFAIPYNLACYACQLGNLDEAWDWLEVAFEVSDKNEIRKLALNDPDLEPLWSKLGKLKS